MIQYINYPGSIGTNRLEDVNFNFKNLFIDFKFIYLSFFILTYLIFLNSLKEKFYYKINFKFFLILFFFLIFHILLTKNQIFIFFLIPLLCGLAHSELIKQKSNNIKSYIKYILIILCIGTTLKYHIRFNIERKFHELNDVNFSYSVNASQLDKKFVGLKWITPGTTSQKSAQSQLEYFIGVKNLLRNDKIKNYYYKLLNIFSNTK